MGCLICGCNQFKTIVEEGGFKYGMCKHCAHVQQETVHPEEYYLNLDYDSQWGTYDEHCRQRAAYIYKFCEPHLPMDLNSLMDVGAGPGGVVYHLGRILEMPTRHGITSPIDQDKKSEYLYWRTIKLIYENFSSYKIEREYDLVTMVHTLEHVVDPRKSLLKLRELVSPSGFVYIEVPSFDWVSVRTDPWHMPVHVSYFSKKILKIIMEESGFEIIKIKESKYWGNIKILAKPIDNYKSQYYIRSRSVTLWKFKKLMVHPIYRLLHKIKKVSPND